MLGITGSYYVQITNLWCESVAFEATDLSPFMGARSGPRCWVPGLDVWEPNLVPHLGARSGPFFGVSDLAHLLGARFGAPC